MALEAVVLPNEAKILVKRGIEKNIRGLNDGLYLANLTKNKTGSTLFLLLEQSKRKSRAFPGLFLWYRRRLE